MYIYKQNDDNHQKVDIYEITAYKEALKRYRKKILEGADPKKLYFELITNNSNTLDMFRRYSQIFYPNLSHEDIETELATDFTFLYPLNNFQGEEYLKRYIEGEYQDRGVKTILDYKKGIPDNLEYTPVAYLLNTDIITSIDDIHSIRPLINLPKELYNLELFLRHKYEDINPEEMDESLSLFTKTKKGSVSLESLDIMQKSGLLHDYDYLYRLNNNNNQHTKILSRIKDR